MRHCIKWLIFATLLLLATVATAANWTQLQERLQQWDGAKEITLPAGVDPLDDSLYSPLVDTLLEQGFAVLPSGSSNQSGLVIESRTTSHGQVVVLKRAADGAMIAIEKLPVEKVTVAKVAVETKTAAPASTISVSSAPAVSAPVAASPQVISSRRVVPMSTSTYHAAPVSSGTIIYAGSSDDAEVLSVQHVQRTPTNSERVFALEGSPLQMVLWPTSDGLYDLFLLYDTYVQRLHYDGSALRTLDRFVAPIKPTRALHLDIGDLNRDGQPELSIVWAEDVHDVSAATHSNIHSWVISVADDGMHLVSDDIAGYVALENNSGFFQKREEFAVAAAQVFPVTMENQRVVVGSQPLYASEQLLFNQLAWPDDSRVLVWNDDQRLMLMARGSNQRIPGSTLLTDFGQYRGAYVSVPFEDPGYRSGFSAVDRVLAEEVYLGRRLLRHNDIVYTIVRGRSNGMLLLGNANGADKLVAIHHADNDLSTYFPFAPIDAFIVDFALYGNDGDALKALVLVNEEADGSGSSYLLVQ